MPIYEYNCEDHGVFSEFENMSSASVPKPCPCCGKLSVRIMSRFSAGWREPDGNLNKFNFNHERFVNNAEYNIKVCEALSGTSRHDIGKLAAGGVTPAEKWKKPKREQKIFASGAVGC